MIRDREKNYTGIDNFPIGCKLVFNIIRKFQSLKKTVIYFNVLKN